MPLWLARHTTSPLAVNLRIIRQIRGWTQSELAARWGVTQRYVSTVENGLLPSGKRLARLAHACGVSERELMSPRRLRKLAGPGEAVE